MTSILLSYVRTQLNVMYSKAVVDTYYYAAESGFRADEVGAMMQYSSLIISWGKGEEDRRGDWIIDSIIFSSDSMIEARSKDDLVSQHGTCDYSVRIKNSVQESLSLTVTVKFSLLGKYFRVSTTLNYF